jgi:hypothetical protein
MKHILLLVLLATFTYSFQIKHKQDNNSSVQTPSYPVRAVYIDRMIYWYGMNVAKNLGLPGYADPHDYNYIIFAFWSCKRGPLDVTLVWQNISKYLGDKNPWGTDNHQVQLALKKIYNDAGIKIMVSAFGSTEFPTTHYEDPVMCATNLGNFVLANNLDGADIDW